MKKKCKVVMLPTNEKALIWQCSDTNSLYLVPIGTHDNYNFQHLYICSDDPIQEGDWYIDDCNKVRKAITSDEKYWLVRNDYKKIIATTNQSLKINRNKTGALKELEYSLPNTPDSFIQEYCQKGGIYEVMVEYEAYGWDNTDERDVLYRLKVNPDNTIIITPVKDTWTRDEVFKLCSDSFWYGVEVSDTDKEIPYQIIEKWIEENL